MTASSVIFIGGPFDGFRRAYPSTPPPKYEMALTWGATPTIQEGEMYPEVADIRRTTYRRDVTVDGLGREVWVYLVTNESSVDAVKAAREELAQARKDLKQAQIDNEALWSERDYLRDEVERSREIMAKRYDTLGEIAAKAVEAQTYIPEDERPEMTVERPRTMNIRGGGYEHQESGGCGVNGCVPV